ncbi:MAG: DUF72 domain-containing protein [Actinomycetota bacterium]|nr:DUF72 domain-containing protein [Actinomycetota bacterium]
MDAAIGPAVRLGSCLVRAGSCSWADRSLVRDGGFYPRRTMTARERLAFYAQQFSVAEVATTFRFPPTAQLCEQWVERTPPGFALDIRAWSLLTGCPTLPDSLWPDLQAAVPPERRDRRRLYARHLPDDALEECWARFRHALQPLVDAGRLGVVVLRYPSWWGPRPETWAELDALAGRLPGVRLAVELPEDRWLADDPGATLEWLERRGLGFVCVDGPACAEGTRPVVAATADVAVVRFLGRRQVEGEPWTWPYRYTEGELAGWVPAVQELAGSGSEVHLLLDNCHRGDAVDNARALMDLVRSARPAA